MNLTGVAMETMRPAGPAKLSEVKTDIYKEVGFELISLTAAASCGSYDCNIYEHILI